MGRAAPIVGLWEGPSASSRHPGVAASRRIASSRSRRSGMVCRRSGRRGYGIAVAHRSATAGRSEAIYCSPLGYPGRVTKRLIEVDDDKLEAVRALLGTRTLKATVDDAFNEVLALAERRRALLAEHGVDTDALADPAARRDAWG